MTGPETCRNCREVIYWVDAAGFWCHEATGMNLCEPEVFCVAEPAAVLACGHPEAYPHGPGGCNGHCLPFWTAKAREASQARQEALDREARGRACRVPGCHRSIHCPDHRDINH